jgi:thiamine biosynthesis protein ThiS
VNVVVKGETRELATGATLSGLLADLELSEKKVAVELNQSVVETSEWASAQLHDGDRIEIVHFVGGG